MIITRTPFRISFAGGGSDLEACYARQPGAVLCTAIDKHMYLSVKGHFGNNFRVSYSKTEFAETVEAIQHPIVRECLKSVAIDQPLEIVSMADLPAQAGMGSSSSFTVGLLHALYAFREEPVTSNFLAEEACRIEIDQLGEPIGKQDQYIAAHGGLQFIQFHGDGSVQVEPVACPRQTYQELDKRLLIFFTGITRNSRDVLTRQREGAEAHLPALAQMCEIARRMRNVLTGGGDLDEFGRLLNEGWIKKKSLESSITNSSVDEIYERGMRAGALGGKLLGAGGGGFLMFYCTPEKQHGLRDALGEMREVPFSFSPQGSRVVFHGSNRW